MIHDFTYDNGTNPGTGIDRAKSGRLLSCKKNFIQTVGVAAKRDAIEGCAESGLVYKTKKFAGCVGLNEPRTVTGGTQGKFISAPGVGVAAAMKRPAPSG